MVFVPLFHPAARSCEASPEIPAACCLSLITSRQLAVAGLLPSVGEGDQMDLSTALDCLVISRDNPLLPSVGEGDQTGLSTALDCLVISGDNPLLPSVGEGDQMGLSTALDCLVISGDNPLLPSVGEGDQMGLSTALDCLVISGDNPLVAPAMLDATAGTSTLGLSTPEVSSPL